MSTPLNLLICTAHSLLATALHAELRHQGHRVSTVVTACEAERHARSLPTDVCLLHLRGEVQASSLRAVSQVKAASPGTSVVLLTDRPDGTLARAALLAGATRTVTTGNGLAALLTALGADRRAATRRIPRQTTPVTGPRSLTNRESDVLVLMTRGASIQETALALQVSTSTVRGHTQRVLEKLGVHSRLQATAIAGAEGLLGMPLTRTPILDPRQPLCP